MHWWSNTKRTFDKNCDMGKNRQRAFTTLEFISVFGLLLLMGMVGFHQIRMDQIRSDEAVQQFASDIRYISKKTLYSNERTQLEYLFEKNSSDRREKICGYQLRENGLVTKEVSFPKEWVIFSDNAMEKIRFARSGEFDGRGETIRILDEENQNFYRVTIVPFSGRVEVYKNE